MRFECVSRTHVGLKRPINEDNCLLRPEKGLFVVADGMGGHEAGEVASARIVEALTRLEPVTEATVVATLEQVNDDLLELAQSGEASRTIGSTVVGLLMDGGSLSCFWAGDSRAYQLRDGVLTQLSRDHSLVQELLDAGMIDPDRAHAHPNGNVITRAVGASDTLRVEVARSELRAGDLYLLASDGVTRVVPDEELGAALNAPASSNEIADGLVWTILRRGAPDNLTMVLVRVG
ncbi:protein phosphatase 2C domain-containing protein [Sphingomonas sp. LHG3406-1]|uniref:PP2C family protein-serine/threonine phosphatase n=1 Tax=Sphingomonas sp. LHG3406-1 TaxID=2804617 RepID=UPI002614EBE0|nr:protein phosphatase 2C domain-containing protein [Sphingomonas sp. LHG3406-1]